MLCPECGARGYSRKTKTPEWRCSKCGHEWDVAPDNPPPIDLLGLTPIALTPNTPRLATLRLLNLIASVVVFAVTAVGLFPCNWWRLFRYKRSQVGMNGNDQLVKVLTLCFTLLHR